MRHLPIFVAVRDRAVVIVGGGEAAVRKYRLVARAGARVTVVAPRLGDDLAAARDHGTVRHLGRGFVAGDVTGAALVYAATGVAAVDERVSDAARAAGIPVNVVDRPDLCTFITPAIVDRDPIVIAISSGGSAPVLARTLRAWLESLLPARLGALARFADGFRAAVKATVPDATGRRRFWERFFDGPIARQVLTGDDIGARERMLGLINRPAAANGQGAGGQGAGGQDADSPGRVSLVGTGPGDPDLLTFRALTVMQQADIVVYDRRIEPQMLDYVRRDADRIDVGTARTSMASGGQGQDGITALMAGHARAGRRVVRLTGGDPLLVGQGGEDLDHLRRLGVAVEVIPGITAASGAAAAAGFPLTHPAHARAVTIVTGTGSETAGRLPDLDWPALADSNQTLVIHDGIGSAGAIAGRLTAHGLDPGTPVAIVENPTRADQRTITGTVAGLADLVTRHRVTAPALIVVGSVVTLAPDHASSATTALPATNLPAWAPPEWFGEPAAFVPALAG